MKVKIMVAFLALSLVGIAHAENRVDGSWFDTACFGCEGDKVKGEVIDQQDAFDKADQEQEANHTVENIQAALDLALFSYDKAGYALEIGRLESGEASQAAYKKAAEYAQAAIDIKDRGAKWKTRKGESVVAKSQRIGKKWLAVAQKHIK
jgi:hypothetical protein